MSEREGSERVRYPGDPTPGRPDHRVMVRVLAAVMGDRRVAVELAERAEVAELRAGELVGAEWSDDQGLILVLAGRLRDERAGRVFDPGHLVGGDAGALRAVRASSLARITTEAMADILAPNPHCLGSLVDHVLRRHPPAGSDPVPTGGPYGPGTTAGPPVAARPWPEREPSGRLVTLLALDGLDGAAMAAALCSAPGVADSTRWLQLGEAGGCGGPAAADTRMARMTRMVEQPGTTLIVADPADASWTHLCIARSDLVVVAVPEAAGPTVTASAAALVSRATAGARVWLVQVREAHRSRPTNGAALLDAVPRADEIHHVAAGHRGDLHRLGRLVAGVGLALVLSGGGARGFAHIGVFRALEELDLPVDRVIGSSIGAVMGALLAQGFDVAQMPTACEQGFSRLLDYTVPAVSLLRGRRITRAIDGQFADWDIEDMALPFACTSTNLTRSLLEVHRRGCSALALRASVAIPGVLPPVPWGGDLLIDGGVLNNLPVDLAVDDPSIGRTIAVDVTPPLGPRARESQPLQMSAWAVVRGRFRSRRSRPVGLVPVLMRSLHVGAARDRDRLLRAGAADLLVPLDLRGVGLLAFDTVTPVVDRGYEQARPIIETWLAAQHSHDRWIPDPMIPDPMIPNPSTRRNHALSHLA